MKTVGRSIVVSVLLTLGITAALNWESLTAKKPDLAAIEVAAGDVPIADPTSPEAQQHCYPVASSAEMEVRMLVDFEARSAKGWVSDDEAPEGQLCLVESPQAVEKRLAEQGSD